jgi:glycosyltransferase involved in cell wall biosynthesis
MNKVSLITGCFNGEKFISRCFESILNQSYHNIEVLFVDDGSTDNSLRLAELYRERFVEKGYEYYIISQKNMGFYPQSGIKIATGNYITTLDIDDILLPDSIKKRAEFLNNNNTYSAVRTNGSIIYENDKSRSVEYFFDKDYNSLNVFEDLLFGKTTNIPGTYMVRANILFEYYPDKIVPMDRLTQNLQILLPVTHRRKVGYLPEPLMQYMRHDEATTSDKIDYETRKMQYYAFKEVRKKILHNMKLKTHEIEAELDRRYNSIFLEIAYKYREKDEFIKIYKIINNPNFSDRILNAFINNNRINSIFLKILYRLGLVK